MSNVYLVYGFRVSKKAYLELARPELQGELAKISYPKDPEREEDERYELVTEIWDDTTTRHQPRNRQGEKMEGFFALEFPHDHRCGEDAIDEHAPVFLGLKLASLHDCPSFTSKEITKLATRLAPLVAEFPSLLERFQPRFYLVGDGCHCCS